MRIEKSADCGNSPKNKLLESVSIALMKADVPALSRTVLDDVVWHLGTEEVIAGKSAFLEAVRGRKHNSNASLKIFHVVTHGKVGAVNGKLRLKSKIEINFCHVFEFSSAAARTIKCIYSYGLTEVATTPSFD
jgi:hypothetical protein